MALSRVEDALRALAARLTAAGVRAYAVAYSGGLDSQCLLHAAASLRLPRLRALHVHHGLRPEADAWLRHCRAQARSLAVPFRALRVRVDARAAGLEAGAREARYAVFAAQLRPAECLLLAQHEDDQAETFLLQALRGAGPEGLSGMAEQAPLGRGWLARPFLRLPRAALRTYAQAHGLRWVEDASNLDERHARNFLRQQVLPLLRTRWPAVGTTLARAARHSAAAAAVAQTCAAAALDARPSPNAHTLETHTLLAQPEPLRPLLLRLWLERLDLPPPDERRMTQILHVLLPARHDACPLVAWPGAELRRYRDTLYAVAPLPPREPASRFWHTRRKLHLPATGLRLSLSAARRTAATDEVSSALPLRPLLLDAAALGGGPLQIRYRQGGERVRIAGQAHSRSLKQCMQDWRIPPWLRDRWPLLFAGGTLAAVPGCAVMQGFAAAPGGRARLLRTSATSL